MPGFDNNYNTMWCSNLNFSDPTGIQFHHPGEFIAAGDLAIGTGLSAPLAQIAIGHLVGLGGITIGFSSPNITIDGSGAGTATTYQADAGSATPAANILNILGAGGITTSGAGNTITITAGPSGLTWNTIAASQTLAVNNGYFCTGGGALALLLPPVSVLGDTIEVYLDGSTSMQITQGAGQAIKFGNQITSGGVGGSITSTGQGDGFTMTCQVANLRWVITACMGNLTFV